MLVFGLSADFTAQVRDALIAVSITPPPPPREEKPPPPPPAKSSAAKGAPSPRNLKNKATPVVAPAIVPLIVPPPIVAATRPALGQAASNGASDRPGPGQGAGGIGNGDGGGGNGGNGDGGEPVVGPRQIKGRLSAADLPEGVLRPRQEAAVGVRYFVEVDGSVTGCRADRSSGFAVIDALACRLIQQRFRFRPARDRAGRPVRSVIVETHVWIEDATEEGYDPN